MMELQRLEIILLRLNNNLFSDIPLLYVHVAPTGHAVECVTGEQLGPGLQQVAVLVMLSNHGGVQDVLGVVRQWPDLHPGLANC